MTHVTPVSFIGIG